MGKHVQIAVLLTCSIAATLLACGGSNPVKPTNHRPTIVSLTAFPEVVGLGDSAIIVCNAHDADGDTLVYDWLTDGRVRLKGALPRDDFLYNTLTNYQIVYPSAYVTPPDTVWVRCSARDPMGSTGRRLVFITITP